MSTRPEPQDGLKSIERLLGEIEASADPNLRASVQELVQLVMDLHGAGIERMLEVVRASPGDGDRILQKLGRDELVSSLLVLYGLHPMDLEARVAQALDKVRLKLRAHDGDVELLSIQEGNVRLRLQAKGHGCGSTGKALREMVENALYQSAPDMTDLFIEGVEDKQGFVPLEMLIGSSPAPSLSGHLVYAGSAKGVS